MDARNVAGSRGGEIYGEAQIHKQDVLMSCKNERDENKLAKLQEGDNRPDQLICPFIIRYHENSVCRCIFACAKIYTTM